MRPAAARIAAMSGEGALSVFARARELERLGRSIIHLEPGEPDFHPAAPVRDALTAAVAAGRDRYCPVQGLPALRDALVGYLGRTRGLAVSSDDIVIAPGCKMALFFALMALVEPGDVAFELPAFRALEPDPDQVAARITPRTKILVANSPGNPTGTVRGDPRGRGCRSA